MSSHEVLENDSSPNLHNLTIDEFESLKEKAISHFKFNIEVALIDVQAGGSIHNAQRLIESCKSQIAEIESYRFEEITQEQIDSLRQKAESGEEEAFEKVFGSDLYTARPELYEIYAKIYGKFIDDLHTPDSPHISRPLPPVQVFTLSHGGLGLVEVQHHYGKVIGGSVKRTRPNLEKM